MTCRLCSAPTSRRLCRQCEIEERAEERARARKQMEMDHDEDEDEDEKDPELLPDGGTVDTDDRDRMQVCPDCSDPRIRRRAPEHPASTAVGDEQYRCRACGSRFDSPVERERVGPSGLNGLAKTLSDADETDLRTDGGDIGHIEAERRARQAVRALDQWSQVARLDLLEIVRDETPVGEWASSTPNYARVASERGLDECSTYRLVCRDCPFEAVSTGSDARDRLHRARDIHRTAFEHDVVVDSISTPTEIPAARLQADGGSDR